MEIIELDSEYFLIQEIGHKIMITKAQNPGLLNLITERRKTSK